MRGRRTLAILLAAVIVVAAVIVSTLRTERPMFSPLNPVRYDAPGQFLCAAGAVPATCLSDLTEAIAARLRTAFDGRPANVSTNSAGHEVVVSVRAPIPDGEEETGTYMLSTTVRLYALRWEGSGDDRRLRGQVALLGEMYRLDPEKNFAWYVQDRDNWLGSLVNEVRGHVTEVTDALDT